MKKRNLTIQIFDSFEDEAKAEYKRRAEQSPKERMSEFAILQERCFGKKWTKDKIRSVVTFEELAW